MDKDIDLQRCMHYDYVVHSQAPYFLRIGNFNQELKNYKIILLIKVNLLWSSFVINNQHEKLYRMV